MSGRGTGMHRLPAETLAEIAHVFAVASGWDEPVAPIGLLPAELVLGIALLVGTKER